MNQPTISVNMTIIPADEPPMASEPAQQRFRRTFHFFQGDPLDVLLDAETNERLNRDWMFAGDRHDVVTHSNSTETRVTCYTYPYTSPYSSDNELHMLSVRLSDVLFIS